MGTANAGFKSSIGVSATDASYTNVGGANSVSANRGRAELDATDFSDVAVSRILGLKDVDFSIDGNYDGADAGQTIIENAINGDGIVWVEFLWDGTSGYKAECVVTSVEVSAAPDGKR